VNISAEMAPVAKVFLHATFIMSLEESDFGGGRVCSCYVSTCF
jgi:hypothetical protein